MSFMKKTPSALGGRVEVRSNPGNHSDPEIVPAQDGTALNYDVQLAIEAEKREEQMTIKEALSSDKKVIFFILAFSGTIIMEGYGLAMITYLMGFRPFNVKYGVLTPTPQDPNNYELEYIWKAMLPLCAQIGSLIGIALTTPMANFIGYRKTALLMLIVSAGLIAMPLFASNVVVLNMGFLLQGIPWGVFQVISPAYASEISSLQLRPILTTWNNLCWVIGQFVSAAVLKGFAGYTTEMGFKIPLAIQWVFILFLFIAIVFIPESPYWYLQKQEAAQARKAVVKIVRKGSVQRAEEKLALMAHTLAQEKKEDKGVEVTGLKEWAGMFKGVDLRRTEIACITWLIQAMCGSSLTGWAPVLFKSAGMTNEEDIYSINMALPGAGAVGTIASWWLMRYVGRRSIYFWGLVAMAISLAGCGLASFAPDPKAVGWAAGAILALFTLIYDLTVGPLCYSIVSEIPSIRRRAATLSMARGTYLSFNLINHFLTPMMLNPKGPSGWGWGPKAGFLYAGLCVLGAIYTFFRIPETMGLSARALDILFQNKVSARKFSPTKAAVLDRDMETSSAMFASNGSDTSMKARVEEKP